MADFTDLNNEVLKVLNEGFSTLKRDIHDLDTKVEGRLTTIEMGVKDVEDRLFGNEEKRVKAIVDQIEANTDRSHDNKRRLDSLEPDLIKIIALYKQLKWVIGLWSTLCAVVGGLIVKFFTWLF